MQFNALPMDASTRKKVIESNIQLTRGTGVGIQSPGVRQHKCDSKAGMLLPRAAQGEAVSARATGAGSRGIGPRRSGDHLIQGQIDRGYTWRSSRRVSTRAGWRQG